MSVHGGLMRAVAGGWEVCDGWGVMPLDGWRRASSAIAGCQAGGLAQNRARLSARTAVGTYIMRVWQTASVVAAWAYSGLLTHNQATIRMLYASTDTAIKVVFMICLLWGAG